MSPPSNDGRKHLVFIVHYLGKLTVNLPIIVFAKAVIAIAKQPRTTVVIILAEAFTTAIEREFSI
jgi:hypothetical protein